MSKNPDDDVESDVGSSELLKKITDLHETCRSADNDDTKLAAATELLRLLSARKSVAYQHWGEGNDGTLPDRV